MGIGLEQLLHEPVRHGNEMVNLQLEGNPSAPEPRLGLQDGETGTLPVAGFLDHLDQLRLSSPL